MAPSKKSRHARAKSPNTVANARQLLGTSTRPWIGPLWVDRVSTQRLEKLFADMAARGYANSTIDRNWNYLNQALQHGVRHRTIKTNPAADVLLPERRPGKTRKSLSIEQMKHLVLGTIPSQPPPGHVADRAGKRSAPGRTRRFALAVRRHRLRLAQHPRRQAGPGGRGPLLSAATFRRLRGHFTGNGGGTRTLSDANVRRLQFSSLALFEVLASLPLLLLPFEARSLPLSLRLSLLLTSTLILRIP